MLQKILLSILAVAYAPLALAQQPSSPQVKVNMLNVCSPSPEDQKEIASALAKVPTKPSFGTDFEIDRGRSSLDEKPDLFQAGPNAQMSSGPSAIATWVRLRREFSAQSLFSNVQYSFSVDPKNMVETLVFRLRDPKDLLQLSIEGSASNVTTPAAMLGTNTPPSRIKLERFGKPSVVLARCMGTEGAPPPDQSAYAPLFESASAIVSGYRGLLRARSAVPEELARTAADAPRHKMPVKETPKRAAKEQK